MGASVPPNRGWGGRWTAAYNLWTYAHRVLHELGIAAIDREELALLSAPLVRVQNLRRRNRPVVLARHADPLHPDEPVGWVQPSAAPLCATLFFLHFDTSDPQRSDRARLVTAAAGLDTPRVWLAVDAKTGFVSLTVSELQAAAFEVRVSATNGDTAEVTLVCSCAAGRYLSVHSETMRARVCASTAAQAETFLLNTVLLPPTLAVDRVEEPPLDCTMALAYNSPRVSPVRIQSRAHGWFLASKPGAPLAASGKKDSGWDGFTLEYDCATRLAKLRDSRGLYLTFGGQFDRFVATTDRNAEGDGLEESDGTQIAKKPESFYVQAVADDDRVVLRSRKGFLSARRGGRITLSKETQPGRNEEFYLRLALPSMMDQSTPRLRLRVCPNGARQVEASVLVPARAGIAYDVLCDYDGFSDFITDASESRVVERISDTELTVLMVQCHTFLVLTIPMKMVLNVVETPERYLVTMDLKHGLGVKEYNGKWQVTEEADGKCLVRCTLLASTSVPAPGFLMDGLMSHATMATMEQIRDECIRRSTLEQNGAPAPVKKVELNALQQAPQFLQNALSAQSLVSSIAAKLVS